MWDGVSSSSSPTDACRDVAPAEGGGVVALEDVAREVAFEDAALDATTFALERAVPKDFFFLSLVTFFMLILPLAGAVFEAGTMLGG